MIRIAPSLLSADYAALGREIETVREADLLHFDVMDGLFVPNISAGIPVLRSVRACTDMILDVHLMIQRPGRFVDAFLDAGADWLSLHVEAEEPERIASSMKRIRERGRKAGLVLKPATPATALTPYLDAVDYVLVMTVEPGFGGQGFLFDMLPKLREIRGMLDACGSDAALEVDGGINPETAALCREAGADVLVAGSDIFKQRDRAKRIRELRG